MPQLRRLFDRIVPSEARGECVVYYGSGLQGGAKPSEPSVVVKEGAKGGIVEAKASNAGRPTPTGPYAAWT